MGPVRPTEQASQTVRPIQNPYSEQLSSSPNHPAHSTPSAQEAQTPAGFATTEAGLLTLAAPFPFAFPLLCASGLSDASELTSDAGGQRSLQIKRIITRRGCCSRW